MSFLSTGPSSPKRQISSSASSSPRSSYASPSSPRNQRRLETQNRGSHQADAQSINSLMTVSSQCQRPSGGSSPLSSPKNSARARNLDLPTPTSSPRGSVRRSISASAGLAAKLALPKDLSSPKESSLSIRRSLSMQPAINTQAEAIDEGDRSLQDSEHGLATEKKLRPLPFSHRRTMTRSQSPTDRRANMAKNARNLFYSESSKERDLRSSFQNGGSDLVSPDGIVSAAQEWALEFDDEEASSSSDFSDDLCVMKEEGDQELTNSSNVQTYVQTLSFQMPDVSGGGHVDEVLNILRSRPASKQTRGRRDIREIVNFLRQHSFGRKAGDDMCKVAARLMEVHTFQKGKFFFRDSEGLVEDTFYILLKGSAACVNPERYELDAEFERELTPGDYIADDCLFPDEDLDDEGGSAVALSDCTVAAISKSAFLPAFERQQSRQADLKAAVHIVTSQPSLMRSTAELSRIMAYLRWHPAFARVPEENLEHLARLLAIKILKKNEVFCLEGSRPENFFILVGGSVSAWRFVCNGEAAESKRLQRFANSFSSKQKQAIHDTLDACGQSIKSAHSNVNNLNGAWTCIDVLRTEAVLQLVECALVDRTHCSASLVSHNDVLLLSIPRSLYLQHVSPFRADSVQSAEAALFVIERLPNFCRTAYDEQWLLRTPLAQISVFRSLPQRYCGHVLSKGKHRRLQKDQCLLQADTPVKNCYLILRGSIGFYRKQGRQQNHGDNSQTSAADPSNFVKRRSSVMKAVEDWSQAASASLHANAVLPPAEPGTVLGEWALQEGQVHDRWPYSIYADEACDLLEVSCEQYLSSIKEVQQHEIQLTTMTFPLQTLEAVAQIASETNTGSRSIQHLEVLAEFLKTYEEFANIETHVRLEVCQWVYAQSLDTGDALFSAGDEANLFGVVLSGEVGLFTQRGSQENQLNLLTVPAYGVLGALDLRVDELEEDSLLVQWRTTARATRPSKILVLERTRFARILSRSHKDIEERERAVITLRYTAPAQRNEAEIALLERLLTGNPFYAQLEPSVRQEACRAMIWGSFDALTTIVKQGDEADKCFIVVKGSVSVWINQGGERSCHRKPTKAQAKSESSSKPESVSTTRRSKCIPSERDSDDPFERDSAFSRQTTPETPYSTGSARSTGGLAFTSQPTVSSQEAKAARKSVRVTDAPHIRLSHIIAAKSLKRRAARHHHLRKQKQMEEKVDSVEEKLVAQSAAFLTEINTASGVDASIEEAYDSGGHNKDAPVDIGIDEETGGPHGGIMVKVLAQGACFGERGLIRSEKRNATIIAREPCECAIIEKQAFNRILREAYMKQMQKDADFLKQHLPRVSTSEHDGARGPVSDDFNHIAGFFSKHVEHRGTSLCSVGRPCGRLYIVCEGLCKVYLRTGFQAPQEIAELGVGKIIGAATHILGLAGEPYHVVCASARVEVLRMEPNDVKIRMSSMLLEAVAALERDRLARLEQRVQSLKAVELLNDAKSGMFARSKKNKWLHTPFLCNKQSALLEDVVKYSQMHRLWSDWDPSGIKGDRSENDSIIRWRYDDDDVAADCPKRLEDDREPAALAWPSKKPATLVSGGKNFAMKELAAAGYSFRSRFVKRCRPTFGPAASSRSSMRRDLLRHCLEKKLPDITDRIKRWVKAHEDFIEHGARYDDEKYVDFISSPVARVWVNDASVLAAMCDSTLRSTWTECSNPEVDPGRTLQQSSASAGVAGLNDAHGHSRPLSDPAQNSHEERHTERSDVSQFVPLSPPWGSTFSLTGRRRSPSSPVSGSAAETPDEPPHIFDTAAASATESDSHPVWPRHMSSDFELADEFPEQAEPSKAEPIHAEPNKCMTTAPFHIGNSSPRSSTEHDITTNAVQACHSPTNGVTVIKIPQPTQREKAIVPCRLPGALNSKHVKHGSPPPIRFVQRPQFAASVSAGHRPSSAVHRHLSVASGSIAVQRPPSAVSARTGSRPSSGAYRRTTATGPQTGPSMRRPSSGAHRQTAAASATTGPRPSSAVHRPSMSPPPTPTPRQRQLQPEAMRISQLQVDDAQIEASPLKQSLVFVQKYGQLGAQRAIERSSERKDALTAKAKSQGMTEHDERAAKTLQAEMELGARRLAGR